ncbi:GAF and ANTAR domain-containing protein [Nocardioides marmorisolisilvae]|uniref:ANTAR domain-containing protein n=1 Tax=Nocardioides marmorisolisilvae TaxID=1542737 RepID=A0A3N0DU74_9ACTN|nr:GAF and ANTAR domain-containing protein [Nocardioides marmorisolisilvae]RNL79150.1 ANTAR domain-containing protein [Nocardioides marmorisolisilvae]
MTESSILETLRALAALAVSDDDLAETAEGVVALACETLDCQHAGLTVFRSGGSFETLAPTGPLVSEADQLQYQLGEGPCVEAAWEEETFVSNDLARDPRYPNWGPKAAAMGFGSLLAARLSIGGSTIGALNLYATETREYSADDRDTAVVFASHAAATLMTVRERDNLKEAVEGRTLIGQAQGILMERFDLDASRSFAVLRRFSQAQNIKLRTVAELVIENGTLPDLEA